MKKKHPSGCLMMCLCSQAAIFEAKKTPEALVICFSHIRGFIRGFIRDS